MSNGWTGDRYSVVRADGCTPSAGGGPVFWQAAALPLSDQSLGKFTNARLGTWPYETPWDAFSYLWLQLAWTLLTMLILLTVYAGY